MAKDYIYAVSRIHAKEQNLLTKSDLDSLMLCKDYESCIRILKDKGYGYPDSDTSSDMILSSEAEKTKALIDELLGDEKAVLDIFGYKADFHNVKLAVKSVVTDEDASDYIMNSGTVSADLILKSVREKEFDLLPEFLRDVCEKSLKTLLETSRGQLCDIIIDKACIEHIYNASLSSDNDAIRLYGRMTALSADVKTAVRCAVFGKSTEFINNAVSDTNVIDKKELIEAALDSKESVCALLDKNNYSELAEALRQSISAFEKSCDNTLTDSLKLQKNDHFSIGPLVAYYIAKDVEIKSVRLILSAKLNGLDDEIIKERLRDLYV